MHETKNVSMFMFADSNFGMLKRDKVIAEKILEVRKKYNWPQAMAISAGKNERVDHPTQKPLKVCTYLLKSCQQKEGDLVVPFSGSGTECVAAKCLKINYIGFEINKDYLKIANDRLLALEPNVEAVEETE